jgi:protein involved in polysaccharide export with SLBB domain
LRQFIEAVGGLAGRVSNCADGFEVHATLPQGSREIAGRDVKAKGTRPQARSGIAGDVFQFQFSDETTDYQYSASRVQHSSKMSSFPRAALQPRSTLLIDGPPL